MAARLQAAARRGAQPPRAPLPAGTLPDLSAPASGRRLTSATSDPASAPQGAYVFGRRRTRTLPAVLPCGARCGTVLASCVSGFFVLYPWCSTGTSRRKYGGCAPTSLAQANLFGAAPRAARFQIVRRVRCASVRPGTCLELGFKAPVSGSVRGYGPAACVCSASPSTMTSNHPAGRF